MQHRCPSSVFLVGIWLATVGCGGGHDYLSDPPEEAAADLAAIGCDNVFDCGVYQIDCDPPTATHYPATEYWPTRAACEAEITPYYIDLFEGCTAAHLTAEQADLLNDCLGAAPHCASESEEAAIAEAICNDQTPPGNDACQRALPIWELCGTCADDPTDPACG